MPATATTRTRRSAPSSPAPRVKLKLIRRHPLDPVLGPGSYRPLARKISVAPQHVSRVLRGKTGVSFEVAQRLAQAAGVTLDELHTYIAFRVRYSASRRPAA